MRRLPVYILLDTSGSMYGEPIEAVKNGVQVLVSTLRSDPYALETAYLSVITFNSTAQQDVPLTELASFQQPTLTASGCTALGELYLFSLKEQMPKLQRQPMTRKAIGSLLSSS